MCAALFSSSGISTTDDYIDSQYKLSDYSCSRDAFLSVFITSISISFKSDLTWLFRNALFIFLVKIEVIIPLTLPLSPPPSLNPSPSSSLAIYPINSSKSPYAHNTTVSSNS